MTNQIDGSVVRTLRNRQQMSMKQLAHRAQVAQSTIYRIERETDRPQRASTIGALARALGVEVDVLAGKQPLPAQEVPSASSRAHPKQQANFRIGSAARNALALVQERYGVSAVDIVESAPLLFLLVAEGSLAKRTDRASAIDTKLKEVGREGDAIGHLPKGGLYRWFEVLEAEEESIRRKDVFASDIDDLLTESFSSHVRNNYDDATENPFVQFLRELASLWAPDVSIESWGSDESARYKVCSQEAHELVGGNEQAARAILRGTAPLSGLPKELRSDPTAVAQWAIELDRAFWENLGLDLTSLNLDSRI